jgi:hypothetical protein
MGGAGFQFFFEPLKIESTSDGMGFVAGADLWLVLICGWC